MARPHVSDQALTRSGVAYSFGHNEVIEFLGAGLGALASGAQTTRGHQDIAVAQLTMALVDEQNFGASLRPTYRGGEGGQTGAEQLKNERP